MLGLGVTLDLFLDCDGFLDTQIMKDDVEDISIFLNDFIIQMIVSINPRQ